MPRFPQDSLQGGLQQVLARVPAPAQRDRSAHELMTALSKQPLPVRAAPLACHVTASSTRRP
jgi:hypothetical protein